MEKLALSSVKYRDKSSLDPPHIGIVGAGVAGLRCADVLLSHGFRVTILEGRNRVGGRVHQVVIPGTEYSVDEGANWIHGADHNPILKIALETKTEAVGWGEATAARILDENGVPVPAALAKECDDVFWGIASDGFEYSKEREQQIPVDQSFYDFFLERVELAIPETDDDWQKKRRLASQIAEMWGSFVGGPVSRQSMRFFWLEAVEGENLFCAGTYQKILAVIAKPALERATIEYNTKVVKVFSAESSSGQVIVTTDKDEKLSFDEVVMTTPLGWLKKNQAAFEPPLPTRFSQAIDALSYGCLEKVYITFPTAFWATGTSPSDDSTGFTQWLSPHYVPSNPSHWIQQALSLATFTPSNSHPTLLFYIFGPQSEALSATLTQLPPSAHHAYLTSYFAPYYSLLPNYDPSCVPIGSFATNWLADDMAGNGSYSNFCTGLERGDVDIEVLREGLPDRGVWVAGEHTSPFVALGTVTGAWWSGEAVGQRIAKVYGKEVV